MHVWSDRAGRLWKQGIGRPSRDAAGPVDARLEPLARPGPPSGRTTRPMRRCSWRGWWDFGTGALGDMGCHIIDHPVWALELGAPTSVEARTTLDGSFLDGDKPNFETYPIACDHLLRVPRARQLAAGAHDLVRRRPDAARPRRKCRPTSACPTTACSTSAARGRCTTARTAACRSSCRAELHEEAATGPQDDGALARPLRGMGRRLQGRPATGLELRLRRAR